MYPLILENTFKSTEQIHIFLRLNLISNLNSAHYRILSAVCLVDFGQECKHSWLKQTNLRSVWLSKPVEPTMGIFPRLQTADRLIEGCEAKLFAEGTCMPVLCW